MGVVLTESGLFCQVQRSNRHRSNTSPHVAVAARAGGGGIPVHASKMVRLCTSRMLRILVRPRFG